MGICTSSEEKKEEEKTESLVTVLSVLEQRNKKRLSESTEDYELKISVIKKLVFSKSPTLVYRRSSRVVE